MLLSSEIHAWLVPLPPQPLKIPPKKEEGEERMCGNKGRVFLVMSSGKTDVARKREKKREGNHNIFLPSSNNNACRRGPIFAKLAPLLLHGPPLPPDSHAISPLRSTINSYCRQEFLPHSCQRFFLVAREKKKFSGKRRHATINFFSYLIQTTPHPRLFRCPFPFFRNYGKGKRLEQTCQVEETVNLLRIKPHQNGSYVRVIPAPKYHHKGTNSAIGA